MKTILFRDAPHTRAGDSAECDGRKRNLRSADLLLLPPFKAELRGHKRQGADYPHSRGIQKLDMPGAGQSDHRGDSSQPQAVAALIETAAKAEAAKAA